MGSEPRPRRHFSTVANVGVSRSASKFHAVCKTPWRPDAIPPGQRRRRRRLSRYVVSPAPPTGGRVVLVSQIKECANLIESFVRHYAALGFSKLLLYLDDIRDPAVRVLEASGWMDVGFVEVTRVTDVLRETWKSLPSWKRVGKYADMEVQSRQILNCEHALLRARQLGADWLMHVDSDELLSLPDPAPVFFGALADRGCVMYTFNNVEGVPEATDSPDVLRSVRLFRQNMGWVPRTPQAGQAVFNWQLRLGGYFISYENGKSAVRVQNAMKCLSVCMWEVDNQVPLGSVGKADGSTCLWFTNNLQLWDAAVKRRSEGRLQSGEEVPFRDACKEAVLMHFCVCDFASFWRKRWTQLGYLSANDLFRVRTTSGAMMARFYRYQCEGKQVDARELFEAMCVCSEEAMVASQISAGTLLRLDPEQPRVASSSEITTISCSSLPWPPSKRFVDYGELAHCCTAEGDHFGAWQLVGKWIEAEHGEDLQRRRDDENSRQDLGEKLCCRARRSVCAGIPSAGLPDALRSIELGCLDGHFVHIQIIEALGDRAGALAASRVALQKIGIDRGTDKRLTEISGKVRKILSELEAKEVEKSLINTGNARPSLRDMRLPSPKELQDCVLEACFPEKRDSCLYRAMLPVAMSWWEEVRGDKIAFMESLAQVASRSRSEVEAFRAVSRPVPLPLIREIWEMQGEEGLKSNGAVAVDVSLVGMSVWPNLALSRACVEVLKSGEGRERCGKSSGIAVVKGCNAEGHELAAPWRLFSALTAEVRRAFGLHDLCVLTELRLSLVRANDSDDVFGDSGGEVDNGGLMPDNRREVSFRVFLPLPDPDEGQRKQVRPALLALHARDGERELTFDLRPGLILAWWSRSTFHRIIFGGEDYLVLMGWGVIPQQTALFDSPSQPAGATPCRAENHPKAEKVPTGAL
eukprot:TRINITY_DN61099_c0_g1_i1.p1 TRINITY_DN61099_c0_g1~~TRINITY_DN61099_c0_g1_i1.p1  ORF type:complete len:922 (-),score=124.67 TRINITY_DN61099_c0_g1_i1:195-2960(-)